jgi:hypothetical protein
MSENRSFARKEGKRPYKDFIIYMPKLNQGMSNSVDGMCATYGI